MEMDVEMEMEMEVEVEMEMEMEMEMGGLLGRSIPALLCWRLIYRSLRVRGRYST